MPLADDSWLAPAPNWLANSQHSRSAAVSRPPRQRVSGVHLARGTHNHYPPGEPPFNSGGRKQLGGKGSREISRVGSGISGMLPKNLYCITPFAGNGREGREGARGEGRGVREEAHAKPRRREGGRRGLRGLKEGFWFFLLPENLSGFAASREKKQPGPDRGEEAHAKPRRREGGEGEEGWGD